MRPKQLLSIALVFTCGSLFSQNYLKVDQNPNAPTGDHVYTDLQTCIDAATNGDIIHIIPAVEDYGEITLNKSLHLVGSGWVSDNQNGTISKISKITFDPLTADGSTLNGLTLTTTTNFPIVFGITNAPLDTLKNVEIFNCKIPGIIQHDNVPIKNLLLRNNIFAGLNFNGTGGHATLSFKTADGMTEDLNISNNIIVSNFATGWVKYCVNAANSTIIKNNLFYAHSGHPSFYSLENSFVSNNVFYGSSPKSQSTSTGNVFTNNLAYSCAANCALPPVSTTTPNNTGGGNLSNTDPLLANIAVSWTWSLNFELELLEFSPLENGGSDGTDIGISGGDYPFTNYNNLRGVPYVQSLNVPGLIMENQDIQMDAVVRTNQ